MPPLHPRKPQLPMPDERVRLFVALELPEHVRGALVAWRDGIPASGPELRPLSVDSLHVTLCFLGWQAAGEIDAIAAACAVVIAHGAPRLSLGEPRWLPARRPRVLAVELVDRAHALTKVQASLSRALATGGWHRPEKREYLAHVTVARVARGANLSRRPLPSPPSLQFSASLLTLFRSRLDRAGARYEPLVTIELGCSARP